MSSSPRHRGPRLPAFRRRLVGLPALREALACAVVSVLWVVGSPAAWGFWTAQATGIGWGTTATLVAPTAVTVEGAAWSDDVLVSWLPAVTSSGDPALGYRVTRLSEVGDPPVHVCGSGVALSHLHCRDASVPDGGHRYVVTAMHHGWTATSEPSDIIRTDTTAPTVAVVEVSPPPEVTGFHTSGPVTVRLAGTDPGGSGVASIAYRVDGAAPITVAGSSVAVRVDGNGHHAVTFSATDYAGRTSSTGSHELSIDTIAPEVIVAQAASQTDPANALPLAFDVTFSEPVTGFTLDDVDISSSAGPVTAVLTGTGLAYRIGVIHPTGDGTITLAIPAGAARDAAGNHSTASRSSDDTITLDTAAPAAPAAPALVSASDTGTSATDGITRDTTPTFTGTTEPGATVTLWNGVDLVATTTSDSAGGYAVTPPPLQDGTHLMTVRAADAAGNISGSSPATSMTLDTQAPVVTMTSFTGAMIGRTVTAAGAGGLAVADSPSVVVTVCAGVGNLAAEPPPFPCSSPAATLTAPVNPSSSAWTATSSPLPGLTTYYARAERSDAAGNVGYSTVSSAVTTSLL